MTWSRTDAVITIARADGASATLTVNGRSLVYTTPFDVQFIRGNTQFDPA